MYYDIEFVISGNTENAWDELDAQQVEERVQQFKELAATLGAGEASSTKDRHVVEHEFQTTDGITYRLFVFRRRG